MFERLFGMLGELESGLALSITGVLIQSTCGGATKTPIWW